MDREKEARAVAWRGVGSVANPANPRGVAIRAELEWRGVGALREFGIARIDGEFQNYNSANSNSKLIPVALEWRCGIGLQMLRRGVITPRRIFTWRWPELELSRQQGRRDNSNPNSF